MKMSEPPPKKLRGPYRRYVTDPTAPVPKTTKWRTRKQDQSLLEKGSDVPGQREHESYSLGDSEEIDESQEDLIEAINEEPDETDGDAGILSNSASNDDLNCESDTIDDDDLNSLSTSDSYDSCEMAQPVYPGSSVTLLATYCLLMEFKRAYRLSFTTMVALLQLLQLLCPPNNILPTTKHQLVKFSRIFESQHSKIDFCRTCNKQLENKKPCSSAQCLKSEPNSLILISPIHAMQHTISDNWTKIRKHELTKKGVIGFVFNTDGISPFKSSRITVWPMFISLINLPHQVRMLKQNVITCMLWVGNCKPKMQVFLDHFRQLTDAMNTTRLSVQTVDGLRKFIAKPLYGVFDMIAKAPVLNMHQFNGAYGCPSCEHPGVRIGRTQTYPPGTDYPSRTTETIMKFASEAEEKKEVVKGIKGISVLASLVDIACGAPIDYMHCILEGVVKRLLEKWLSSTGQPYYINKSKLEQIDSSLVAQTPPHDFARAPRSISKHRAFWKASEYRAWILFYSLPLIIHHYSLPALYIHHFALLVSAVHMLLQPKLTDSTIEAADVMLRDFVSLVPELYDEKECTINCHLLVHVCDSVRKWGPLWAFSAFPFEHKNGYIMGHVHSANRISDQLLFSVQLNSTLDSVQSKLLQTESPEVLSFLGLVNSNQKSGQELIPGSYAVGRLYQSEIETVMQANIKHVLGACPAMGQSFTQVFHNGTLFHSIEYGRTNSKRDSTVCAFLYDGKERFGQIQKFLIVESIPLALIKPFSICSSLLQEAGVPGRELLESYRHADVLASFIIRVKCQHHSPVLVVKLDSIVRKCIKLELSSEYMCIAKLPNYYECH